jgi:hypothetical protein
VKLIAICGKITAFRNKLNALDLWRNFRSEIELHALTGSKKDRKIEQMFEQLELQTFRKFFLICTLDGFDFLVNFQK